MSSFFLVACISLRASLDLEFFLKIVGPKNTNLLHGWNIFLPLWQIRRGPSFIGS
jgi:hypothetical protein